MFQRSTELLREREVIYFDKAGKTFPEFKSQISPAEKKKEMVSSRRADTRNVIQAAKVLKEKEEKHKYPN